MKRTLDIVVAAVGMLAVLPVLALVALAVRLILGAPVVFKQTRVGRHSRLFPIFKFRTMRSAFDRYGNPLPDELRLGSLGRFLRASSLDELLSLFNVLRGDMSLVGPRPLLPEYLPLYSTRQARRHEVRPGITGWAQVHGRNSLSWEEKFELDVWYVEHQSFSLDLRILAMTVWKVFRREGISQAGHVTAEPFRGSGHTIQRQSGQN